MTHYEFCPLIGGTVRSAANQRPELHLENIVRTKRFFYFSSFILTKVREHQKNVFVTLPKMITFFRLFVLAGSDWIADLEEELENQISHNQGSGKVNRCG